MLQILRNKAQSIVIQAIVVIIALVFIFWGVGTNLMNNREAAIVVNDEEISFQDYQNAYDQAFNNLQNQFGGNMPQGLLESIGLEQQVTEQLIQEAILRQGAAEMGISVSREEVQKTVQDMAPFQENGRFSLERYTTVLATNGYSPQKFEKSVELDMLARKAREAIGEFAATVTPFEVEELYRLEKASVSLNYSTIDAAGFTDKVEVNDEELKEWYATVQDNYKSDPAVKLRYLDFSYSTIGQKINIDDAAVEQHYQRNITEYTTDEERRARHILLKADEDSPAQTHEQQRAKAEEILKEAKQGEDFAELARKYSEDASQPMGGDLGLFSRGQMVKPFEDAAFALEEGGISDVVKTPFGYHIIKVEEIVPQKVAPLEEVRDDIVSQLRREQAQPLAFQMANEAYEGIIAAGSLDAYLEEHAEADVQETELFTRKNPPTSLADDEKFLDTAFSLKEGELSSLIETDQGYAILFAAQVTPPVVPELDTVKERVLADFRDFKAQQMAQEAAKGLLQAAQEQQSLEQAAEQKGFTVTTSDSLTKYGSDSQLPQNLIEEAFKLTPKEPFPQEPLQIEDTFFVYMLADRKVPQGEPTASEKERYRAAIAQMKEQQILSAWLTNQRQQAEVMTHKSL